MSERDKNHIDQLLQDRFANFGSEPEGMVWDSIAQKLEEKRRKRRRRFWLWFSGALGTLLLVTGLFYYGSKNSTENLTAAKQPATSTHTTTEYSETENAANTINTGEDGNKLAAAEITASIPEKQSASTNISSEKTADAILRQNPVTEPASDSEKNSKTQATATPGKNSFTGKNRLPVSEATNNIVLDDSDLKVYAKTLPEKQREAKAAIQSKAENFSVVSSKNSKKTFDQPHQKTAGNTPDKAGILPDDVLAAEQEPSASKPVAAELHHPVTINKKLSAEKTMTETETGVEKAEKTPVFTENASKTSTATADKTDDTAGKKQLQKTDTEINLSENNQLPVTDLSQPDKTETKTANQNLEPGQNNVPEPENTSGSEQTAPVNPEEVEALEKQQALPENGWDALTEMALDSAETKQAAADKIKEDGDMDKPGAVVLQSVEIFASPEWSYRTLSVNEASFAAMVSAREQYEERETGFSAGLLMAFELSDKYALKTGLKYMQLREKLNYPAGTISKTKSSYDFLSVPLQFTRRLNTFHKLYFDVSAGPEFNLFIGGESVTIDGTGGYELKKWADNDNMFKTVSISVGGGVGVYYRVSKLMSILVKPHATYFPGSIYKNNDVEQKPYSVGVQGGIRFGFY